MTDTEGANTKRPQGDDHEVVPAAGGTFGVTDDQSEFGRGPVEDRSDVGDDDTGTLDVEGLTNDDYADRVRHEDHVEYEAYGNGGEPAVRESHTPGSVPQGYGQQREQEFAPTQFGAPSQGAKPKSTYSIIALGLAVVALVLLCFPGWTWVAAGIVGVLGIVTGVIALSREPKAKAFSGIGIGGSAIAIALSVATAIVVAL
jgi:hypothetical protein